ncbi:hypothetical protein BATDEDRAFT_85313 [Batrachochytrium dendrobatidis JAM81]|uniref:Uncharacterized protein n=1 Tax=Batrachochytrium dendrobatidis (strain JAM81 / FGSC 10211) TaxID=684364 RepID=F4NT89_BATDJ|nr:uncharacterized protein BATDEDRAFT_85313 [Batrachochytrium dendrobatidis JAM81]EGF84306.1 hypothetical protein BATDEDRAFT_85313 [Batrachochytrium dendrobatidis JAM81]|eukprot:XP_006676401.1 hypothetical protein BATDEDRAFT_85313 [Batrachochytrium dendrobatidis JAM81]
MKFTHISAFTIAALATSVHAILPQPSETIDSVDPSPSPSLNSQSVPQATSGPEFPSTSTTQGPGGSQGDHSNQTPRVRLKSYDLSGLLRNIRKKHKSNHQKTKTQPQYRHVGTIDLFLESLLNIPQLSELDYQGGDYGLADHVEESPRQQQPIDLFLESFSSIPQLSELGHQGGDYGPTYHVEENSRQQQLIEVIAKGINAETSKFKKHLLLLSIYFDMYEVWVKNILNFLDVFEATGLVSEFINGLGKIFKEFLEIIHVVYGSIYQIVLHLNKDSGLLENAVKAMFDLADQFMSRQMDAQQLFKELFERYSKIDWYHMNLGLELALWLQELKMTMQIYNE